MRGKFRESSYVSYIIYTCMYHVYVIHACILYIIKGIIIRDMCTCSICDRFRENGLAHTLSSTDAQ